ncbi:MAG TPA: gliding motility protein GldM [Mucilaginibacter sp.]|jgi:gliding motility-associated protein GldM|nr:gliding motility protein GldM [Mucilaginibacter sp.]
MAGGKQTPRQRMMGILYLVLLGLIALDVPESLLDAFKNISDSLSASKTNVEKGINNTFEAFEKTKLKEQPERAKPVYEKALKAKKLAEDLNAYVESLKKMLIDAGGGFDEATQDYKGRENIDISVDLMVNRKKNAYDLHKKIDATREALLALLTEKERVGMKLALETTPPPHRVGFENKSWEQATFGEGMPMGGAITSLNKIQSDAMNAENEVVKKILGEVDQAVVNLDQFSAVAVAPTSYVLVGQPYTAEVFLTASDSKSSPDITVDGSRLATEAGRGKYTGSTSTEGVHTWIGTIIVKDNNGKLNTYKTEPQSYTVARPSAVVSPDKMNVLYIGVPNPVSISAPGISKDNLHVSMSGGSLSKSGNGYIATVSTPGTATVNVSGEVSKGKVMALGASTFRVKRIPDPKAMFAGKSSGTTSAANLKGQDAIFAKLENFDFDAKFNVTRFSLMILKPRQDVITLTGSGNQLTSAMHTAMNTLTPGSKVAFTNIVAVGPDGTQRGLDDIILSAN